MPTRRKPSSSVPLATALRAQQHRFRARLFELAPRYQLWRKLTGLLPPDMRHALPDFVMAILYPERLQPPSIGWSKLRPLARDRNGNEIIPSLSSDLGASSPQRRGLGDWYGSWDNTVRAYEEDR